MKKEALSIIIIKTILAVIIFAGMGTIIVGGGWLIGKQGEISLPYYQPSDKSECKIDSDCQLTYTGYSPCLPCDTLHGDYECLTQEEIKRIRKRKTFDIAVACKPCQEPQHICKCENGKCEKVKKEAQEIKTGIPIFWALGSEPDAISVANTTDVLFTTMQTGLEDKADKIIVEELDISENVIRILGDLNDSGINGDLSANDYIYSGTFKISSLEEGNLFFRAKANFSNISEPIYTDEYKLGVTRFPIGLYFSDMSRVTIDPKTGEKMVSNEVIVGFTEGTSPDTIKNIIKAVNAEIVGTIFGLGAYQIKISDTGDAIGVNKTINKLLDYPEIKYAEPNYIIEMDQI